MDGDDDDEYELVHVVYPGNFSPDYEMSKITLKVPLRASGPEPQMYIFTMTSNEGQGLDVGAGAGYEVWLGPDEYGELLFEGGQFYYEETNSFEIEPYFTLPTTSTTDQNPRTTSTATTAGRRCRLRCSITSFLFSAWSIYIILN